MISKTDLTGIYREVFHRLRGKQVQLVEVTPAADAPEPMSRRDSSSPVAAPATT